MELTRRVARTRQTHRRLVSSWCAIGAAAWIAACAPEATDERIGEAAAPAAEEEAGAADAPAEPTVEVAAEGADVPDEQSAVPEPLSPAEAGLAFLASNAMRDGVTTTDSGLQYEVLASGDGESPGPTDVVRTHYHGTLVDGRVFDSSVQRGEPLEFRVDRVIGGWTEALQMMRVGDKWKLFIPPELAYGARGASGSIIGPNETLIFEVELLAVNPAG